jgi:hypothetical protein
MTKRPWAYELDEIAQKNWSESYLRVNKYDDILKICIISIAQLIKKKELLEKTFQKWIIGAITIAIGRWAWNGKQSGYLYCSYR